MSNLKCDFFYSVMTEYLGCICSDIFNYIIQHGSCSLSVIYMHFKNYHITMIDVKMFLCHLIQHNIVIFKELFSKVVYEINLSYIQDLIFHYKFFQYIKNVYGNIYLDILINLFVAGRADIISIFKLNYSQNIINNNQFKKIILNLLSNQIIQRAPWVDKENYGEEIIPNLIFKENFAFNLPPSFDFDSEMENLSSSMDQPYLKKLRKNTSLKVYWMINTKKVKSILLNKIITNSFSKLHVQSFLKFYEDTDHLQKQNVLLNFPNRLNDYLDAQFHVYKSNLPFKIEGLLKVGDSPETIGLIKNFLNYILQDWKLRQASEHKDINKPWLSDNGIMLVDKGGSNYTLLLSNVMDVIFNEFLFAYIFIKYGSSAARIFNLIRIKKACEQKKIEESCMMPPKEAKENLYILLQSCLIKTQEISKTADFAPSRTFYVFRPVPTYEAIQILWNRCSQIYVNFHKRLHAEMDKGKHLFDKQAKIDAIISNIPGSENNPHYQEQVEEIKASLLPSELLLLQEITESVKILQASMLKLSDIFLIIDAHCTINCNHQL